MPHAPSIRLFAFAFIIYSLSITLSCTQSHAHAADQSAAVILTYFRIDEDYIPEENLDSTQFFKQMKELETQQYKTISLPMIIDSYKTGASLPEKTVAITFEGGYKSILNTAAPYLLEHKIPFTIFFAPEKAEKNDSNFLNWEDLKSLSQNNFVTLGVLPYSYTSLAHSTTEQLRTELNMTKIAYRNNIGSEPEYFSYPYGEYNSDLISLVKEHGYKAAFGLQTGVAYAGENLYTLPRFSFSGQYNDMNYFKSVIKALPLPASNIEPQNPIIGSKIPVIGFTIDPEFRANIATLNCFVNGAEKAEIEKIGLSRIEIRLKPTLLNQKKTRINCTLPVLPKEDNAFTSDQWRWIGFLFTKIE